LLQGPQRGRAEADAGTIVAPLGIAFHQVDLGATAAQAPDLLVHNFIDGVEQAAAAALKAWVLRQKAGLAKQAAQPLAQTVGAPPPAA
jgi:hypothetical protein